MGWASWQDHSSSQNYIILGQKHLVCENQVAPLLQLKVNNIEKCEEYLDAIIEINDSPSSEVETEVIGHRSLDEGLAEAIDEMMVR